MDSVVIKDVELKSRCHIDGGFNPENFDFVNTGRQLIPQIRKRSAGDEPETQRDTGIMRTVHDATFEMMGTRVRTKKIKILTNFNLKIFRVINSTATMLM